MCQGKKGAAGCTCAEVFEEGLFDDPVADGAAGEESGRLEQLVRIVDLRSAMPGQRLHQCQSLGVGLAMRHCSRDTEHAMLTVAAATQSQGCSRLVFV